MARTSDHRMSSCKDQEEEPCGLSQVLMTLFQLSFRFFLPTMMLRWSVDIALAFTELALALTKDFVRSGPSMAQMSEERYDTSEDRAEEDGQKGTKPANKSPSIVYNFLFSSWWDVITWFATLAYYMTKLFSIYFVIPYLSYQMYFLNSISAVLHCLAGMNLAEQEPEHKDVPHNLTSGNARSPPRVGKLSIRRWMADLVLNRVVSKLMDIPPLGLFLRLFGIKPQINLFRRMQNTFKGNLNILNIREDGIPSGLMTVVTDIGRFIEGDLAPHLNLDEIYNKEDLLDESSDDSME